MHDVDHFLRTHHVENAPFGAVQVNFCDELSKALFAHADIKHYPDVMALAFWLRKAHVEELRQEFESVKRPKQSLVPRGLVFHIAPANVETLFVYSWILAMLVGNTNIVRLPSRESLGLHLLFQILHEVLQRPAFEKIQKTTCLVSYGHELAVTEAISAQADMRVIWGGDETIRLLRKVPLKPLAHEITFGDRFAMAAIHAKAYLALGGVEREKIIHGFYNDVFWYDQMACASPRIVFWVGEEAKLASQDFYERLHKHLQDKKYSVPLAVVLKKETYLYNQALVLEIQEAHRFSNELTVVELQAFDPHCREQCGGGLLYSCELRELNDMASFVNNKDQTLVQYGFKDEVLNQLVSLLNGKGIDRIVPIGQALQFDYQWDGYHLLREFTKVVRIDANNQ